MNGELIRRENRRFSLTPAGEYFYSHSKAILEQVDDLIREAKQLGENQELRLRIGYLRCYSGLELHQAIAEASGRAETHALYPDLFQGAAERGAGLLSKHPRLRRQLSVRG